MNRWDGNRSENKLDYWEPSLLVFERQVLVFPLLVVLLACVSFFFGGRCASWQWWASAAIVIGVPSLGKPRWQAAITTGGLFAGLLLAVKCLVPPMLWDNSSNVDMPVCHLPMIQLLIEGWNPVADPLASHIMGLLKLDYWGMAPLHVVFSNKPMAVFAAVAYQFVGDPTALTIPGLVFLWMGVALETIRLFHGFSRWVALSAVALVLPMVVGRMPVDLEVAFASCGLLLTMQDALRKKACDWLSLVVWGAWMMNLKANGLLAALVFFAMFVWAKCRRERDEVKIACRRFAILGVLLIVLWTVISWNPFGSAWMTFGHPLYPYATVDADRFPVCDLTADMKGNADAKAMGKMGAFSHAYLSPTLTEKFFRWKLKRNDFSPYRSWWSRKAFPSTTVRIVLWVMFAVLLVFPQGRPWATCGFVLLLIMPNDKIGFTRYQPWLSALGCLAIIILAEQVERRMGAKLAHRFSLAIITGLVAMTGLWCWQHARDVEYKAQELSFVRERIRPLFWTWGRDSSGDERISTLSAKFTTQRYNYLTCMLNRTRLLVKELGREGKTAILPTTGMRQDLGHDWIERDWPDISGAWRRTAPNTFSQVSWKEFNVWDGMSDNSNVEAWMREPFCCYWIPADDSAKHVIEYFIRAEPGEEERGTERALRRMKFCAKAWGVTYPKEVWKWLTGKRG